MNESTHLREITSDPLKPALKRRRGDSCRGEISQSNLRQGMAARPDKGNHDHPQFAASARDACAEEPLIRTATEEEAAGF